MPDPATPVRRESLPPLPSAWMAARCSLENRMPASPASTASIARRIDGVGERVGAVDRCELGFLGDVALDPQLLGMAEPDFAFVDAEDEGDGIAVMDEAALLEQIHHRVDVIPPARRPGLDQAAGGMDAQPLGVEDGRRLEFRRERFRRQSIGRLMALGGCPLHGRRRVEDGFRRPADGSRLLPPDRLRLVLAFAEPSGRACFVQELLLALERELVPLHGVIFGVSLGVADHLAVALGKGRNRAFGDIESDDGLAIGVEPDPDAERPQAVGQPRLKDRAVFMDLVGGQRLRIDRADSSIVRDHEVRDEIVEMVVGIAGDRRVHQIGRPVRPVLDGQGRPGGVMSERHPADLAALGAFLARMPLPRDAEVS